MNELEERTRRALDAARAGHDPSAADAARVRAALKARVLAEPLLIQPGLAPAAVKSGVLAKVLLALGVGGSLGFAAGLYVARTFLPGMPAGPIEPVLAAARASETSAVERPSIVIDAPQTARVQSPAPAAPPRPKGESTSRARAGEPAVSPIQAELDGLRRAQELLFQGRPAWALARLDELDRASVGSVLLEERAATRAIAECRLGVAGSGASDEYARRFPRSAHLEQVRASCSGAPQGGVAAPGGGTPARKVAPTQTESRGSQHEE